MGLFVALVANGIGKIKTEPRAYRQLENDEHRRFVDMRIAISHYNQPLSLEQLYRERDANSDEVLHMDPTQITEAIALCTNVARKCGINPDDPTSSFNNKLKTSQTTRHRG